MVYDHLRKSAYVRLIERRIDFVEYAEGARLIRKIPIRSDSAVCAFSPPESSNTFCSFLPGGEATMSMPLVR